MEVNQVTFPVDRSGTKTFTYTGNVTSAVIQMYNGLVSKEASIVENRLEFGGVIHCNLVNYYDITMVLFYTGETPTLSWEEGVATMDWEFIPESQWTDVATDITYYKYGEVWA